MMEKNKGRPLIRKQYNFAAILKMLVMKIFKVNLDRDLNIPRFAESVTFKSMVTRQDSNADTLGLVVKASSLSREHILSAMKAHDLRGLGGSAYPMADKLHRVLNSGNKELVLIINGVECDPGLYHDKWILQNKKKELSEITGVLKDALGLTSVYLAVKEGTLDTDIDGAIRIDIKDAYPAGYEKNLVKHILGIECGDEYPADKGIWIQNVQSLLNLHSVLSGAPISRYLTMMNLDNKKAIVVECDADAFLEMLAAEVFGDHGSLYIGGGIMQGTALVGTESLDSRINFIATGKVAEFKDADCRHCGQCTRYCPAELPVEDLVAEIEKNGRIDTDTAEKCYKCGSCSYLCPAGKDLCSIISSAAAVS